MIDLDYTFFIQFINFVVTLVVLNILLIRPIREIIKKRADTMTNLMDGAEEFTAKAKEKLAGYSKALDEARAHGTAERNAVKEQGLAQEKLLVSDAAEKAQAMLSEQRKAISQEAGAAASALKAQVGDMAARVAGKVLA